MWRGYRRQVLWGTEGLGYLGLEAGEELVWAKGVEPGLHGAVEQVAQKLGCLHVSGVVDFSWGRRVVELDSRTGCLVFFLPEATPLCIETDANSIKCSGVIDVGPSVGQTA